MHRSTPAPGMVEDRVQAAALAASSAGTSAETSNGVWARSACSSSHLCAACLQQATASPSPARGQCGSAAQARATSTSSTSASCSSFTSSSASMSNRERSGAGVGFGVAIAARVLAALRRCTASGGRRPRWMTATASAERWSPAYRRPWLACRPRRVSSQACRCLGELLCEGQLRVIHRQVFEIDLDRLARGNLRADAFLAPP